MADSNADSSTPNTSDADAETSTNGSHDEFPTLPSEIAELLHGLKTAGHEELSCEYSGEGDEGNINEIALDSETLGSKDLGPDPRVRRLLPHGATDFATLEGWLGGLIYHEHGGYQDNEGGGGEVTIDLRTGRLTHERFIYTVQTEALDSFEHDLFGPDAAAGRSQPSDATTSSTSEDE
jgi:hypothetical protein